jgi:hypothetical protein
MRYLKASASPAALAALERMLGMIDMRATSCPAFASPRW